MDHVHLFSYLALNGKLNGENSFTVVLFSYYTEVVGFQQFKFSGH